MLFADGFLDIKKIQIAHRFILDRINTCEYPLGRAHYGLVLVLGGKAEYRFSTGERFTVTDGGVIFFSPHAAYSVITDGAFEHYTVNFDIHEDTSDAEPLSALSYALLNDGTEPIKREFKRLVDIWQRKKIGYQMQAVGCLYELLSLFCFEYTSHQVKRPGQRLHPAREYIERNFDKPITLEQLAFLSNMSATNFRREWKKHYAESPMQYRDSIRLYYAKEYLNIGYYTISEIAGKCGFDDVSYFIRFFKKHTGATPGRFKKQFVGK